VERLREILCRPILDTPRTRRYQAWIDASVERVLETFDLERGLSATKGIESLPDETIPGYIDLPRGEREKHTPPDVADALRASQGRGSTAALGTMAFCYRSPLSRYHGDERVLRVVRSGMESFRRRLRRDGVWVFGLSEERGFGLGWTVEGLIYAYVYLYDRLEPEFREAMMEMFRASAEAFQADGGFHPVCNQHAVWCMTMMLYSLLFDDAAYRAAAERQWAVCKHVFARDGQVIEQGGPCANYSRTTFIYAYLYILLAGTPEHDEQLKEACRWFRRMHTNSMHPFEGMSSRSVHFLTHAMTDVLACLERFAPDEPIFARFIEEFLAQQQRDHGHVGGIGHGASPLMWAMMDHRGMVEPRAEHIEAWNRPFDRMYWKPDIQYLLVHRRYQTAVTFRGRSSLLGLQTWAWGDEPPIIHPAMEAPSKTIAWGIDTAEFGISHNRAGRGAGWKTEEVTYVPGDWRDFGLQYEPAGVDRGTEMDPVDRFFCWTQTHHHPGGIRRLMKEGDPAQVVTRWALLWTYYIFTPGATLVLQNGPVGRRVTRWACNPVCCPPPRADAQGVAFEGREGRLYALDCAGRVGEVNGIPVVEFAFEPEQLAVFAFSDSRFRFEDYDAEAQTLTFADSEGRYRACFAKVVDEYGHVNWDPGAYVNRL